MMIKHEDGRVTVGLLKESKPVKPAKVEADEAVKTEEKPKKTKKK